MTTAFDEYNRRRWSGRGDAYARSLASLCAHAAPTLLDAAGARAGLRLLDAGTGPGTVAGLAATRGAVVTAVDAEPSMAGLARRGTPGIRVLLAGLPSLPFADRSFDAAVANFVLNHVGDPLAAVRELSRVVRGGGVLAATVWPNPLPPLQAVWQEVVDAAGPAEPPREAAIDPERDFPRTAEGLADLLRRGGLTDVTCHALAWRHRVHPEDWWLGAATGFGVLGRAVAGQPPEVVARVRQHFEVVARRHTGPDGLLDLPTSALVARGTRPGD